MIMDVMSYNTDLYFIDCNGNLGIAWETDDDERKKESKVNDVRKKQTLFEAHVQALHYSVFIHSKYVSNTTRFLAILQVFQIFVQHPHHPDVPTWVKSASFVCDTITMIVFWGYAYIRIRRIWPKRLVWWSTVPLEPLEEGEQQSKAEEQPESMCEWLFSTKRQSHQLRSDEVTWLLSLIVCLLMYTINGVLYLNKVEFVTVRTLDGLITRTPLIMIDTTCRTFFVIYFFRG